MRLVEQILDAAGEGAEVVFDPFSGTGTTALCAAYRGKSGVAADINPFLIWLANAKARCYSESALALFEHAAQLAGQAAADPRTQPAQRPPISNIERWWEPPALEFLLRLKTAIDAHATGDATLLKVAFCRTMIRLSNAAFNHQSMSFRAPRGAPGGDEVGAMDAAAMYADDVRHIAASVGDNPRGTAEYLLSDARDGLLKWRGRVDLLITSPPYPNRMSYIRELRPYMYWLRFLSSGREAGELDWAAIGGTWGVATSRLSDWQARGEFAPPGLAAVLKKIRAAHERNGRLLANYVERYFEDMFTHLQAVLPLLRRGATAHYIVGNSIFYGHMVPAQDYLAQQMAQLGLRAVRVEPIRKRNSKKGLVEFQVSGTR